MDKRLSVDVLYFDFAKAFDRIPKNKLLYKLERNGIRGPLLAWIDSFLTNRSFSVRDGKSHSEYQVVSGVPQSFVLGPLQFLVGMYSRLLAKILRYLAMHCKINRLYKMILFLSKIGATTDLFHGEFI